MSRKLYLECSLGISGDMTVAALLDLGADKNVLNKALESIPIDGFKVEITNVKKSGIKMCDFNVILDEKYENHDHDLDYLHGEDSHKHNHNHNHNHKQCAHEHRGIKEIKEIIYESNITSEAKTIAMKIFNVIAEAEAKAHDTTIENVHFHEVGAVDSIVDIVAVAVCLDNLNIKEVVVPILHEGYGTIRCQHGVLPIPVPAVTNIIEKHKLNINITNYKGELITPTGAAIVAAIKTESILPTNFKIIKVGMGAGKRQYESPTFLRAMLIDEEKSVKSDSIYKLESNIDDCNGENLGLVMEKLMEEGAKDVHFIPVFMKKNRPAYILNVICREEDLVKIEDIIFKETTTIGIRKIKMERSILEREIITIDSIYGQVTVKVCDLPKEKRYYPEYEDIRRITKEYGITYQTAYINILNECINMEKEV